MRVGRGPGDPSPIPPAAETRYYTPVTRRPPLPRGEHALDTRPLTPTGDTSIVIPCPVCMRAMWAWGTCHHGTVPTQVYTGPREGKDTPAPPPHDYKKNLKGGLGK